MTRPRGEYPFAGRQGRAAWGRQLRPHPAAIVSELASLALPAVVVLTLLVTGSYLAGKSGVVPVVAVAVAGAWVMGGWVNWNSTSLTLTDEYVILKRGVLGNSNTIPRNKIQAISMTESIPGRVLGYHAVLISTADGHVETFGMAPRSLSSDDILGPAGFID